MKIRLVYDLDAGPNLAMAKVEFEQARDEVEGPNVLALPALVSEELPEGVPRSAVVEFEVPDLHQIVVRP